VPCRAGHSAANSLVVRPARRFFKLFRTIPAVSEFVTSKREDEEFEEHFSSCYNKAIAILKSLHDAVADEIALDFQRSANNQSSEQKVSLSKANKKVFVVHGHAEKLKTQVARFLEKLELQPIILHEQPDRGQTIIEKFEKHSDVSFAVVLLTPDDEGRSGKSAEPHWSDSFIVIKPPIMPRARQNVIFEFGYFIGKLGRANVCGLYCEGVELPSDYSGVLYTKVDDDGTWQFKLMKELKAAGFVVDANRLT
jgi:predicted nucleotide-binding protein